MLPLQTVVDCFFLFCIVNLAYLCDDDAPFHCVYGGDDCGDVQSHGCGDVRNRGGGGNRGHDGGARGGSHGGGDHRDGGDHRGGDRRDASGDDARENDGGDIDLVSLSHLG